MWSQMSQYERDFFQAAISGEEDGILYYLKDGGDINEMFEYDEVGKNVSALMISSENGHMDCVKTLLRFGADISHLCQHYTKAILYTSQQNMTENLTNLAAAGMFGKERDADGDVMPCFKEFTNLTQQGNFEKALSLLSDSNFSVEVDNEGLWESILSFLILAGCPKSHVDNVIKNFKIDLNGYNCRGFTPLISAVIIGNVDIIEGLIEQGADVNRQEDLMRHAKEIECTWVEDLATYPTSKRDGGSGYSLTSMVLDSDAKSPIMYAVWTGKFNVLKCLLAIDHIDVDCSDSQDRTVLVHAVYAGSLEIVDELLANGMKVDEKNSKTGRTVLFEAVCAGKESVLKRILQASAENNVLDRFGMTALLYAAETGKIDSLKVLLEYGGFDINFVCRGHLQYTAMMYAAKNKHYNCLKLLLDRGADMLIQNEDGLTVLDVSAEFAGISCLKLLIEEGLKGDSTNKEFELCLEKALQSAAQNKDVEILRLILSYCNNVNAVDDSGFTAIMSAASAGQTDAINLLLQHKADVNLLNEDGESALWHALHADEKSSFELLIEAGSNINYVHKECEMLLVLAARKEDIEYLEILLQKETQQVNMVCQDTKYSPLTAAISNKRIENVRLLLDSGADVNLFDKRDNFPLMYATRWLDCLRLLLDAGANVNVENDYAETIWFPVTASCECLKMLLEDGAVFDENSSPRRLKHVHADSSMDMSHNWDVRSLLLIFDYRVFEWDWYGYGNQIREIHKIAFAAVNVANNSPVLFDKEDDDEGNKRKTSLLQEAFLGNKIGTVRYLLANLFLRMEDYLALVCDSNFQMKIKEQEVEDDEEDGPEIVSLFKRVTCQPWRLETLSFLAISSSLASSPCNQGLSRSQQIDSLALPEILKSKLKYDNAVRKLCPSEWESIGDGGEDDDILAVMKPLYPSERDLSECEEECSFCFGCGYVCS